MAEEYKALLLCSISRRHSRKLHAFSEFGGNDARDIAEVLLEEAIDNAWEGYRNNPKHAKQIEIWEKENADKE